MNDILIGVDDPRADDVLALLGAHLALMRSISPPDHVHALDLDGLTTPDVTFLAARGDGALLGVGALKQLDERRGEIKSMHTAAAARGRGVGRLLVDHILRLARERGTMWVGLETGTQPEFEPARSLYRTFGFVTCEPFAPYTVNDYSTCMSLDLRST